MEGIAPRPKSVIFYTLNNLTDTMVGKTGSLVLVILIMTALALPCRADISGWESNDFESLDLLVIEGEQQFTGRHAQNLRRGIDAYGNNDSHVTSPEVTNFESVYEDFVGEHGNEYTLNGIEGTFINLVATFKDAVGPVNSTDELTYEYQGRISFTGINPDLDSYTFRVVNEGGDLNTTMNIRITIPSGFGITAHQGVHAAEISDNDRTIRGQTITNANVEVAFSPTNEFSWMFWPLLISALISVILVAAWVISNSRGKGETFQEQHAGEEPPGEPRDERPQP